MKTFKLRKHADYSKFPFKIPPIESMGVKTQENGWQFPEVDIRSRDVSKLDLSAYDMQDVDFDTLTKWPKESKCPKKFKELDKILELGKDPGLGVRELHQKGIDGRGLTMAIIDQPLGDHQEYHDNLVYYEELDEFKNWSAQMHGSAVASISVGKTCGVAPKAKLYYWAAKTRNSKDEIYADNYAKALERILEVNRSLAKKEKIQVVSVSWGGQSSPKVQGSDKWLKALEQAKKEGIFVCTCASGREYDLHYFGLNRKVLGNPNQTSQIIEITFGESLESIKSRMPAKIFENNMNFYKLRSFSVPMDHRTTAAPNGYKEYVHYYSGGMSWTTPYVAGLFLLARQVNPQITPEHFWEIAIKKGKFREDLGVNVVQPVKLIDTLQKEYSREKTSTLTKTLGKHCVKNKNLQKNERKTK